jgi:hypothetical protein
MDAMMAIMVMRTADKITGGLPADVRMKMYINIIVDFGIGLVPFLGDVSSSRYIRRRHI